MTRRLSETELQLWGRIVRSVKPMRGRRAEFASPAPAPVSLSAAAESEAPAKAAPVKPAKPPASAKAPAPVQNASGHRRVRRGDVGVEARLDLHGLTHDQAKAALIGFVLGARKDGVRRLLVITGKGRNGTGVLRARFLDWLEDREIRSAIAGYAQAHARHGGEGAFYVLLKA